MRWNEAPDSWSSKCPDPKFSICRHFQVVARKRQSLNNKALRELPMGRWMIKFNSYLSESTGWIDGCTFSESLEPLTSLKLEADLGVNVAAEASVAAFLFTEETFAQSLRRISFRNKSLRLFQDHFLQHLISFNLQLISNSTAGSAVAVLRLSQVSKAPAKCSPECPSARGFEFGDSASAAKVT